MKKLGAILLALILVGCAAETAAPTVNTQATTAPTEQTTLPPETTEPTTVATEPPTIFDIYGPMMDSMTTEELVGQLFLARYPGYHQAAADQEKYHLGGYILFYADFEYETPTSSKAKLDALQEGVKIPMLLAVDEEGGTVARLSSNPNFRSSRFPSPRSLYDQGGMELILETELEKCQLLRDSGVNVNMAPVCDITTDPYAFMYKRSLGQSPEITGEFVQNVVGLMKQEKIGSVLKHFPGYGNNVDTHVGSANDAKSLEELESVDLVPFAAGITAGCDAILVTHTIIESLDKENPATLSPAVMNYLRENMGFEGVIVTDDLRMDAIAAHYSTGDAAVQAILAGNDLLCSSQYITQYEAVLQAVLDGTIPMDQIRQSVARILKWKTDLGLIPEI